MPNTTPDMLTDEAVGVSKRHWFVALVDTKKELLVRDYLKREGYEAFVASRMEEHTWANRQRKQVEQLIISRYVFVHVTEQERKKIVWHPYIKAFLINRAVTKENRKLPPLAIIPDKEINLLRIMLQQPDAEVMFAPEDLTIGKTVVFTGLGYNEIEAEIIKLPCDNKKYVGVRIKGLGCAYMQIPQQWILKVSDSSKPKPQKQQPC